MNQYVISEPTTTSKKKKVRKKRMLWLFLLLFLLIGLFIGIVLLWPKKPKYEYKNLDYAISVEPAEIPEYDSETVQKHLETVNPELDYTMEERPIIANQTTELTEDNIYSSEEAVDWDSLSYGEVVFVRDENGNVGRLKYVPDMTEELLSAMQYHLIQGNRISVSKGAKLFLQGDAVSFGGTTYTYSKSEKQVFDENGNAASDKFSFSMDTINNNEEFLFAYLTQDGFPLRFSTNDIPIRDGYEYEYLFAQQDTNATVQTTFQTLAKEYGITAVSNAKVTYALLNTFSSLSNAYLGYIIVSISGTNAAQDVATLYVTYSVSVSE